MGSITKNWKKILIITGGIVLAILLFYKLTWKPTVVNDYLKSDIDIKTDVFDGIKTTTKDVSGDIQQSIDETNTEIEENRGSRSIIGWVAIIIAIVFGILILDMLMTSSDDKKKK